MASIALQAAILTGLILLVGRRFRLAPGSFSLIFTLNGIGMSVLKAPDNPVYGFSLLPAMVLAGIVADFIYERLGPRLQQDRRALRLFGFGVPAILYLFYFIAFGVSTEMWWTIHLWAGSIVIAGIAGWLTTYLIEPPGTELAKMTSLDRDAARRTERPSGMQI